ncbi:MAG: hypothetical protein ACI93R_003656 [Flavobacteriales bacterium]|jgi:hypothetical protein
MEALGELFVLFGPFALYKLGQLTLLVCTLGQYRAEKLDKRTQIMEPSGDLAPRELSRKQTMLIGFFTLCIIIILIVLKTTPLAASF